MIPAISPPTDSLYKLMAIFGLGLLVLGVINTAAFSDNLMAAKVEIEQIEQSIADTLFKYNALTPDHIEVIRQEEIKEMTYEELSLALENLETYIFQRESIPGNIKAHLSAQLDIIQIKYSVSERQRRLNNYIIVAAVVLIIIGFLLWYLKDQKWKDLQLKNESLPSKAESA